MASWKKVIVSGSQAELLNITASAGLFNTSLNVGTNYKMLKLLNPWLRSKQLLNSSNYAYKILIPTENGF